MSEPEKIYPTGEFVILAKYGGHVLRPQASRLANVIRQEGGGRGKEGGRLKT